MHPEAHETPAEALLRLRRGEDYDVAVLDMQMPEMDGVTLAGEIRRLRDSLPLVLASSLAGLQPARSTAEFAVQLTKPIKASQLYEALLEALGAAGFTDDTDDTDVAPAADASSLLRILVAEDNARGWRHSCSGSSAIRPTSSATASQRSRASATTSC
jgi:CheY-like chemotaxis protein